MPTQNELKFHYTVHTSLDVVEEKISAVGKSLGDQRELYLGLLYPTEDYKVYPCLLKIKKRVGGQENPQEGFTKCLTYLFIKTSVFCFFFLLHGLESDLRLIVFLRSHIW